MAGQHYCLRWNNYQSNMTSVFHHLLRTEAFVDVTLACDNDSLKAHKVVLSACSSYFQKILLDNPSQHPTIIMPHDVCMKDLTFIIEFVYRGEIDVSQSELQSLLKTADQLKIKGLCEVPEGESNASGDMPEAELTPHPPLIQSHSPVSSAIARVNRFRRLSVQAKRRLDTRKRLFRESLLKQQQMEMNEVAQTQTVHTSQQTIHQTQPNLHQTHQNILHTQQNSHSPQQNSLQNQQSVLQSQQNLHQTQQSVLLSQQNGHQTQQSVLLTQQNGHQTQQSVLQTQQNSHQTQQSVLLSQQNSHQTQQSVLLSQQNGHQTQQSVLLTQQNGHQTQQSVLLSQQNGHQTQQSVHQSQQNGHQAHQSQQIAHQAQQSLLQPQHLQQQATQQDSQQQTQMIQAIVTSVHDPTSPHNQLTVADALTNCITVATSTDDDMKSDGLVILDGRHGHTHATHLMMTSPPPIMSTHAHAHAQVLLEPASLEQLTADVATQNTSPEHALMDSPVHHQELTVMTPVESRVTVDTSPGDDDEVKVKYETMRAIEQTELEIVDNHISPDRDGSAGGEDTSDHSMHTMMITPELLGLIPSSSTATNTHQEVCESVKREAVAPGSKTWTQEDMDAALDALRTHSMSLTKASITYGIPSTTLWQRAHRLGIDTPKKDGPAKSWTEDVLNVALEALRNGSISANKASKAYGIPSSTLYKIARREGIRLAAPFNAAPTTWSPEDLERALEAIRSGQTTVQRAAADFGIPSGTLYGRCKREGIELSRNNPTPWSEDAMTEALEAVRLGHMSINQAAIHYNLPYSSLYGRFKRVKYEADHPTETEELPLTSQSLPGTQIMLVQYQQPALYQHTPS